MNNQKTGYVRYGILAMLFIVTTVNYADRATMSIAGPALQKEMGIDAIQMGYIFSAFGWAYVMSQIPGGWLLDRFGSKRVYAASILTWSSFTVLQGFIGWAPATMAITLLFVLRFLVGMAEAPSFPGNSRIVAAWFPTQERGTAAAIFNSAQYFATVIFAPLMGWLVHGFGWHHVFIVMGGCGIFMGILWLKFVHNPKDHPRITPGELDYIANNGGLVDMDQRGKKSTTNWSHLRQLLTNRMLMGVYLGQYCINAITYFFLTWFPVYLVQERGMSILKAGIVASLPAICGFIGGVGGGFVSDALLRRGHSLTFARKLPIVLGLSLSSCMIVCNYVQAEWLVVGIMALAFFGKGLGALGWAVVADTAPKQVAGLAGGVFNTFGNVAAITTPIVIGYLVGEHNGSFKWALVFVAGNALVAVASYLFIVGRIQRVVFDDGNGGSGKSSAPLKTVSNES